MNLMLEPLRKYAQFRGRARRSEYWMFMLFLAMSVMGFLFVFGVLSGIVSAFGTPEGPDLAAGVSVIIGGLALLAAFIPILAVTVRRLHDINMSGWWVLLRLVPFIGGLVLLLFLVLPGVKGSNRFGQDPKEDAEDLSAVFA
jgi:uncharacterized membrane protein YhaH (DUF805 family)